MFGKTKTFTGVKFSPQVLEVIVVRFLAILEKHGRKVARSTLEYEDDDGDTHVRNGNVEVRSRCFAPNYFNLALWSDGDEYISFKYQKSTLDLRFMEFSDVSEAEELLDIVNKASASSKLPLDDLLRNVEVFIGHGRSHLWRDLKDHLQDLHNVKVIAYETGARAGYTIQEVLQQFSLKASLALLVHTGEDEDKSGQLHARENVIHETGLFQGKMGFRRAVILLEDGSNEFSNIAGLQQIRFQKGNIKETFGDVLAILRREFTNES